MPCGPSARDRSDMRGGVHRRARIRPGFWGACRDTIGFSDSAEKMRGSRRWYGYRMRRLHDAAQRLVLLMATRGRCATTTFSARQ